MGSLPMQAKLSGLHDAEAVSALGYIPIGLIPLSIAQEIKSVSQASLKLAGLLIPSPDFDGDEREIQVPVSSSDGPSGPVRKVASFDAMSNAGTATDDVATPVPAEEEEIVFKGKKKKTKKPTVEEEED